MSISFKVCLRSTFYGLSTLGTFHPIYLRTFLANITPWVWFQEMLVKIDFLLREALLFTKCLVKFHSEELFIHCIYEPLKTIEQTILRCFLKLDLLKDISMFDMQRLNWRKKLTISLRNSLALATKQNSRCKIQCISMLTVTPHFRRS